MVDVSNKLQSVIIQFQELKKFAQQSFLAFIRSTYLMQYKDVFDVRNIDTAALARSYGLPTAPRVRFLARAVHKNSKEDSSEKTEHNNAEKKEKTISELVEMIKKTSKNLEKNQSDIASDDTNEELVQVKNAKVPKTAVGETLSLVSKNDSSSDDDELLKITKRDVFHILESAPLEKEELTVLSKKKLKLVSRQTAAKMLLKKGVPLNVKKVFTTDEVLTEERHDEPDNKNVAKFDIEEAKREMAEVDKLDKAAYKEKLKKWRQEKKAKQKKRLEKEKLRKSGAVLDFGENEEFEEEPDVSWLPNPDKPKKYDEYWNEISEDEKEEVSAATVDELSDNCDDNVSKPRKKRMKTVTSLEQKALKLLDAD